MAGFRISFFALLLPGFLHAQRSESGVYVMTQGTVEVTHEFYEFDGTILSDTVDFPLRGIRLESVAEYGPEHSPVSYTLDLFRDSSETPVQHVEVSFGDTTAVWSTHSEFGDSTGVTHLNGPYAFMQNLVFAHLAVVLLQYDYDLLGTQRLNVWIPERSSVLNMEIEFTSATEGHVKIAGTSMNVCVDERGWLRSASVPEQNLQVQWRETGTSEE